jgi:hypothetical protein
LISHPTLAKKLYNYRAMPPWVPFRTDAIALAIEAIGYYFK